MLNWFFIWTHIFYQSTNPVYISEQDNKQTTILTDSVLKLATQLQSEHFQWIIIFKNGKLPFVTHDTQSLSYVTIAATIGWLC